MASSNVLLQTSDARMSSVQYPASFTHLVTAASALIHPSFFELDYLKTDVKFIYDKFSVRFVFIICYKSQVWEFCTAFYDDQWYSIK